MRPYDESIWAPVCATTSPLSGHISAVSYLGVGRQMALVPQRRTRRHSFRYLSQLFYGPIKYRHPREVSNAHNDIAFSCRCFWYVIIAAIRVTSLTFMSRCQIKLPLLTEVEKDIRRAQQLIEIILQSVQSTVNKCAFGFAHVVNLSDVYIHNYRYDRLLGNTRESTWYNSITTFDITSRINFHL